MAGSTDSRTPIMTASSNKRASKRFSTFSGVPSLTPSDNTSTTIAASGTGSGHSHSHSHSASPTTSLATATSSISATSTSSSDPRIQEIRSWSNGFQRLDQKRLQQQRYAPTNEKTDKLSKLALGAKVERALERRMTDQDATFRQRPKLATSNTGGCEKAALKGAMGRSVTTAV